MNPDKQTTKPGKSKPARTDSIRVMRETKKRILIDLAAVNKKDIGRKVTVDDYVQLAISLLNPEHLQKLKDRTLSNKDRLEIKFQEHCSQNGKVSKDEFIGLLLAGGQSLATN